MTPRSRWLRWGRWVASSTLACCAAMPSALAQAPFPASSMFPEMTTAPAVVAAPPAANVNYTKSTSFSLPVEMDEPLRQSLKEIRLYVKSPTKGWTMQEVGAPNLRQFTCRCPQDGEYLYTLMTVDKRGTMTPPEAGVTAKTLRVVVDTQAPQLQIVPLTLESGEAAIRCVAQDPNLDARTLQASCKQPTGETALEPVAGMPGVFRLRSPDDTVTVSVSDLARNVATKEYTRESRPEAQASSPGAGNLVVTANRTELKLPVVTESVPPTRSESGPAVAPPKDALTLPAATTDEAVAKLSTGTPPTAKAEPSVPTPPARENEPERQILNTTRANIDYRIDQVGQSGVGKVDVYYSTDKGTSWLRLGEDLDRRSPAEIDLPGEGIFGVRLAITNGNGFGGSAPKSGDPAHCWVEVDLTPPYVQFRQADIVPGGAAIDIRWTATDRNLGTEPVALYYRTRSDANWQPIARNLKNDGTYRWTFPRDGSTSFFFKVEVADVAGNVARTEAPNPLVVDITEPRVSVVGISGAAGRTER